MNTSDRKKYEILSPAGDAESLSAALNFGADAVYLAGKEFGMRTASKNFAEEELYRAVEVAHKKKAKLYVTCNSIVWNDELERLPGFLHTVAESGADAIIIADLGVLSLAKKHAPDVDIHISTQAGVTNYAAANELYALGARRIVLARELPITEIKKLRERIPCDLEIECFVHGAMCVSFSGRCIISSMMTGRDANRGNCAQPCRWKYHLYEETRDGHFFPIEEDDDGTYLYNSRDLCMINHLPELIGAGVNSFKIEGRAKSAYYTALVTNSYRKALDFHFETGGNKLLPSWIPEELNKISHREYSTGFFFGGEPGQSVTDGGYIREYEVIAVCEHYDGEFAEITQRNRFFCGNQVDVLPLSGIPYITKIIEIKNEFKESITSAPHAMQRLFIKTEQPVEAGSILRKKR